MREWRAGALVHAHRISDEHSGWRPIGPAQLAVAERIFGNPFQYRQRCSAGKHNSHSADDHYLYALARRLRRQSNRAAITGTVCDAGNGGRYGWRFFRRNTESADLMPAADGGRGHVRRALVRMSELAREFRYRILHW